MSKDSNNLNVGINKEIRISFFTSKTNDNKSNLPTLRLVGQDVPRADYVKCLGIILDDCLIFKNHITKLRAN